MGELEFEEPEVDITALSDETRGLIRILMLTSAIFGLYLIWFSALPALQIFDEVVGDNSLGLLLRCFVDSIDLRVKTMSALNEAINDKFNAAGISIAFPQRDLHLDTIKPLRVQIEQTAPAND